MNINVVNQFLTIVKYMNMSKAAQELFVSQPALSLSITKLEKELGVALFLREGNKLTLTNVGNNLYDHFSSLSQTYDNLIREVENYCRASDKPTINIGFSGSAFLFFSLYYFGYLNQFESAMIEKIYANNQLCIDLLNSGYIDLAITTPSLSSKNIANETIITEEMMVLCPKKNKLFNQESVTLEDLRDEQFIGLDKTHFLRKVCDTLCEENSFSPHYVKELNHYEYERTLNVNSNGDTFLRFSAGTLDRSLLYSKNNYKLLPFKNCSMRRVTSVSYLVKNSNNIRNRNLINFIKSTYGDQLINYIKLDHFLLSYDI